jgi:hypothetical protein
MVAVKLYRRDLHLRRFALERRSVELEGRHIARHHAQITRSRHHAPATVTLANVTNSPKHNLHNAGQSRVLRQTHALDLLRAERTRASSYKHPVWVQSRRVEPPWSFGDVTFTSLSTPSRIVWSPRWIPTRPAIVLHCISPA